jgi:alanyl-tRNA synthetase
VIHEEESSFIRTLSTGIHRFNNYIGDHGDKGFVDGHFAFELYDTYGFPVDLTQLMAREKGLDVDMQQFEAELNQQKVRSRKDAEMDTGDWVAINPGTETKFTGYDETTANIRLLRYRKVRTKGKTFIHALTDITPFYPESGGQVGDTGYFEQNNNKFKVIDTRKENNLIIHVLETFPDEAESNFKAVVDASKRILTANNHSATHLMHDALRKVLGNHVEQKGSFVGPDYLRFDFSHFGKMTNDEIKQVETVVNEKIRMNLPLDEHRSVPRDEAENMGALMFFGEKYGEVVRVVRFGESIELCGGTHVPATGQIGLFRIISEGAIAAGIRRIEAVTANKADEYIESKIALLNEMTELVKNPADPLKGLKSIIEQNNLLQKQVTEKNSLLVRVEKEKLLASAELFADFKLVTQMTNLDSNALKELAFELKDTSHNLVMLLGSEKDDKANLSLFISNDLVTGKNLDAGKLIRELAKEIQGGGGGQSYFATAGGKNTAGLQTAFSKIRELLKP